MSSRPLRRWRNACCQPGRDRSAGWWWPSRCRLPIWSGSPMRPRGTSGWRSGWPSASRSGTWPPGGYGTGTPSSGWGAPAACGTSTCWRGAPIQPPRPGWRPSSARPPISADCRTRSLRPRPGRARCATCSAGPQRKPRLRPLVRTARASTAPASTARVAAAPARTALRRANRILARSAGPPPRMHNPTCWPPSTPALRCWRPSAAPPRRRYRESGWRSAPTSMSRPRQHSLACNFPTPPPRRERRPAAPARQRLRRGFPGPGARPAADAGRPAAAPGGVA
jgi:hypothetical protein